MQHGRDKKQPIKDLHADKRDKREGEGVCDADVARAGDDECHLRDDE